MELLSLLHVKGFALLIHVNMLLLAGAKLLPAPLTSALAVVLPLATADVTPTCSDGGSLVTNVESGLSIIVGILLGLGVTVAVIGIIIGGLMRATAFGNERRIAASNTAITGAVVGIVIVVVAVSAGESIPGWFNGEIC